MATIIILLGAPGAGKGTQATRLCAELDLPHISTGDLFRAHLGEGTPFGIKAKEYMDAGKLVPDQIVLDMLTQRVAADDCSAGFLLDGFPRTLAQAEALGEQIDAADALVVINLEVDDETIIERAAGRLLCRANGHIHHREFAPPHVEGVCDTCGGELYQRKDDAREVVGERLRVYHEQTVPLVRFYRDKGVLEIADGQRSPDEVFAQLEGLLPKRG